MYVRATVFSTSSTFVSSLPEGADGSSNIQAVRLPFWGRRRGRRRGGGGAEERRRRGGGGAHYAGISFSIIGSFFEIEHNRQNFQKASLIGKSFGITSFCQRN